MDWLLAGKLQVRSIAFLAAGALSGRIFLLQPNSLFCVSTIQDSSFEQNKI